MTVITRFAPSPTGYLHIGSARSALFNYLFAKHHNGKFMLRIEDTDKQRSTQEATDAIFSSLKWLGINWDGEVIFQSTRMEYYKNFAMQLLQTGKAYYCFASQEEIEQQRSFALSNKQAFIFKSKWRDASPEDYPSNIKPVIRLKAPKEGNTVVHDKLQGDVVTNNQHMDDMVLLRSDGSATYMLAVVVDDHDMAITHIIRGDDHLTNAARQILIYEAFGWQVPEMIHIPLIHASDGTKLSKRHGALGVESYKEMGYLPEALVNYLLRLGWAHGDAEIISHKQAIEWFDIKGLGKSPARLDFAKMRYLNAHYLRNLDDQILTEMIIEKLTENYNVTTESKQFIYQAMPSLKIRAELLNELVEIAKIYLVENNIEYSEEILTLINNCDKNIILESIEKLEALDPFTKETIQECFKKISTKLNIKIAEVMQPVRAILTGKNATPSVFEIIAILGKKHTIKRLTQSLQLINKQIL